MTNKDTIPSPRTETCPTCRGERWVCEAHPLTPWGDCCGEPGVPCHCNRLGQMPPGFCEIYSVHDED